MGCNDLKTVFLLPHDRDGQNHHKLMILRSKSNHLNKGDLKSKSNHFGSGDLKIKITLKIILKYSLYSTNFDVLSLLTALAIIHQMKHVIST